MWPEATMLAVSRAYCNLKVKFAKYVRIKNSLELTLLTVYRGRRRVETAFLKGNCKP